MKLQPSARTRLNTFTGYGEGYVMVNGERHEASLIVQPEDLRRWPVSAFAALAEAHFAQLAALAPEVVLLGTGGRLRFPHPRLSAPLARAGIGLEVMDVRAACRTYNILMAEDRRVLAALIFE